MARFKTVGLTEFMGLGERLLWEKRIAFEELRRSEHSDLRQLARGWPLRRRLYSRARDFADVDVQAVEISLVCEGFKARPWDYVNQALGMWVLSQLLGLDGELSEGAHIWGLRIEYENP